MLKFPILSISVEPFFLKRSIMAFVTYRHTDSNNKFVFRTNREIESLENLLQNPIFLALRAIFPQGYMAGRNIVLTAWLPYSAKGQITEFFKSLCHMYLVRVGTLFILIKHYFQTIVNIYHHFHVLDGNPDDTLFIVLTPFNLQRHNKTKPRSSKNYSNFIQHHNLQWTKTSSNSNLISL